MSYLSTIPFPLFPGGPSKIGPRISAPMIERKLTVYFADKEIIYGYLYLLEENRDNLIYGRSTKAQIELVLKNFLDVKELLSQKLKELGETIE